MSRIFLDSHPTHMRNLVEPSKSFQSLDLVLHESKTRQPEREGIECMLECISRRCMLRSLLFPPNRCTKTRHPSISVVLAQLLGVQCTLSCIYGSISSCFRRFVDATQTYRRAGNSIEGINKYQRGTHRYVIQ
jgi:hypothetical protein